MPTPESLFAHLARYSEQLWRQGKTTEAAFHYLGLYELATAIGLTVEGPHDWRRRMSERKANAA